jgi:putative NIF3 family GTP cyclohydrolase 1 type 2
LVPIHKENAILNALKKAHPYEEVAYGMINLTNTNQTLGAGMIGILPKPLTEAQFLKKIKLSMQTKCIRHTPLRGKMIEKVAICGGSGSFLLQHAIQAGADAFITGDFKYHQFFDAEQKLIIADIGHYESEQFTPEIFYEILSKIFPNFAFQISSVNTNPVYYY